MTLGNLAVVNYHHADHRGTLRALSDSGGDDGDAVVYTAFGERIDGPNHRYGYVGALGYRAHEDFACDEMADPYAFPYLHVGWRYYDPASGRFLQRDPIGIDGGINVYVYVGGTPTMAVDPLGLHPIGLPRFKKIVLSCDYYGRWDFMPRPGGAMGGHMHVFDKTGKEVAKVNERGGWAESHKGKSLQKPSEVPSSVRNRINRVISRIGSILDDVSRALPIEITIITPVCPQCGNLAAMGCACPI